MKNRIGHTLLLLFLFFCTSLFAQSPDSTKTDTIDLHLNSPFTSFLLQTKDSKKVFLQWAVQPGLISDYFTIERNVDGKTYETIGLIKFTQSTINYEFTDEIPTRGNSLYRIRLTGKNGESSYSDSNNVYIPGSSLISYYPNPMDNVLIVRSAFPSEISITDGLGKVRITRVIGVGPSVIDVSTLEKGVYLLRITDKLNSVQQVEKLLKN